MLGGSFYTIGTATHEPGNSQVTIAFNAEHPIFEGHFPGKPVVPGVCMMQTIQEVLEAGLGRKVLLRKANTMKFMNMIDPNQQPEVEVAVQYKNEEAGVKVTATVKRDATVFMKFQGIYQ